GPSGSGKSTLLAFVAGFLDPVFSATGRALLDGEDITAKPANLRRTAMLFQDPMLFPHMSVGENLLFWQSYLGAGPYVETALQRIGLAHTIDLP
ncbi:MAG: ATP-binding cassette domain-containing protein, partial [Nitratireductor sp.]|nr:ATP-binding cassette domain-containing protein [Nitratireductor sp.]